MEPYNLDDFEAALKKLAAFFTELAAREDEILTYGLKRATTWDSYSEANEVVEDFDSKLHGLLAISRAVDHSLHESIDSLLKKSNLSDSVGKLFVSLKIAENRQKLGTSAEMLNAFLMQLPYISNMIRHRRVFEESKVPIHEVIVTLNRLAAFTARLHSLYWRRRSSDDDIFKPSNIKTENLIDYIEKAIDSVENEVPLPPDQKKQALAYLQEARDELARDRPSWNKIVGALVISATLLSGIASAPQAFDNVQKAITYILGTSVEKYIPPSFPQLDTKKLEWYDKNEEGDDDGAKFA